MTAAPWAMGEVWGSPRRLNDEGRMVPRRSCWRDPDDRKHGLCGRRLTVRNLPPGGEPSCKECRQTKAHRAALAAKASPAGV